MVEKALAGCAYNSADWSAIENLHSKDVGTFILLPKQMDSNTLRLPTLAKLYDRKQLALHQICKNTGEYSHYVVPLQGGSTYCFTAVSVSVCISVSVSVRSHPTAPPARFFFWCTKI